MKDLVAAVRGAEHARSTPRPTSRLDDVIDPADTRARLVQTLAATPVPPPDPVSGRRRTMVDAW